MKPLQGRVFKRYIFSYLSVALIICLALGLALTLTATRQLRMAEVEIYQGRLLFASDYIEQQISVMEDIRLDIKTNLVYQPFYLQQNVIYDMDLINAFAQYSSYSSWVDEYYLWYRDSGKIYSPNSAYSSRVFFEQVMGGISPEAFSRALSNDKMAFQVPSTRPDSLMICLPFYFGTAKTPSEECVLIFAVKLNKLRRLIWEMTDAEQGASFTLRYDDAHILGSGADVGSLTATGTRGRARLYMSAPSFASFERLAAFERLNIAIILAMVFAGAAMAVYAAWYNYRPIRSMYSKYALNRQAPSNELQAIDELLSSALKTNALSQKQMNAQMDQLLRQRAWLKQQLVMMLISGNDSPSVQKQIREMGFEMDHEWFAIFFLHLVEGENADGLVQSIEDLSDEECSLYAAELQENRGYALLANFDDEEQRQTILELLSDTLSARNLAAQIQPGRSCAQLEEIASAVIEALNAPAFSLPDSSIAFRTQDDLDQLTALIELGNTVRAQTLLETMIVQIENRYPSYLIRIYMLNRLSQQIAAIAHQKGIAIPEEKTGEDNEPVNIHQSLHRMVTFLCASAPQANATQSQEGGEAAAYVREHCLDEGFSLSSVAEALGVSTKQVTRLLRAGVGMTFRDYLLQLRMEAAQRIIREDGLSIAETAEKVGYYNISHFIKCFKSYTGVTPGEWKKLVGGQQRELYDPPEGAR
jgi:AraC-like DNA-binding protein